jgi:RsiW-degrading membrane proteinase PrsW (M82 family)
MRILVVKIKIINKKMIEYKTIFLAVLIGIIPAIGGGWWFFGKGQEKIGINLLFKIFFWGVLTAIPASIFQIINAESASGGYVVAVLQQWSAVFNSYFVTHSIIPFLFVALVEEFSKGVGIILSLRSLSHSKKASRLKINPGALVGVIVGLAFGVTENGVYFANNFSNQVGGALASIIILRFILSTSAHMIYSGLLGVFMVEAVVARGIFRKMLAFGALSIPIIIHMTFDVLVTTDGLGMLSIPLLVVGFVLLFFKTFWSMLRG